MALHGRIMINRGTIGAWEVHRLGPVDPETGLGRYRWSVMIRQFGGRVERVIGELDHEYSAGALLLLAAVIDAAIAELYDDASELGDVELTSEVDA